MAQALALSLLAFNTVVLVEDQNGKPITFEVEIIAHSTTRPISWLTDKNKQEKTTKGAYDLGPLDDANLGEIAVFVFSSDATGQRTFRPDEAGKYEGIIRVRLIANPTFRPYPP